MRMHPSCLYSFGKLFLGRLGRKQWEQNTPQWLYRNRMTRRQMRPNPTDHLIRGSCIGLCHVSSKQNKLGLGDMCFAGRKSRPEARRETTKLSMLTGLFDCWTKRLRFGACPNIPAQRSKVEANQLRNALHGSNHTPGRALLVAHCFTANMAQGPE